MTQRIPPTNGFHEPQCSRMNGFHRLSVPHYPGTLYNHFDEIWLLAPQNLPWWVNSITQSKSLV